MRGALQWALAVVLGVPMMIAAAIIWLPLSVPLWAAVCWRTRKLRAPAAAAQALPSTAARAHPLELPPRGWLFCYCTCVAVMWHFFIRTWAVIARPRVVFIVYHNTIHTLASFFCMHTGKVLKSWGIVDDCVTPELPWFLGMGLIWCGPSTGLGLFVGLDPVLDTISKEQLAALPRRAAAAFPFARSIALAGRLPGLVQSATGAALAAPVVDGLAGTVFAMEETVHALRDRLPEDKRGSATVAILGGGGFIGSRLVRALAGEPVDDAPAPAAAPAPSPAAAPPGPPSDGGASEEGSGGGGGAAAGAHVEVLIPGGGAQPPYRQVIALDLRYKERAAKGRVLYTSDPSDLSSADVVLVITAKGEDAEQYVEHAVAGQEWGDDTHPEMGARTLRALASKGVRVTKAMAARAAMTRFHPPLPGWPAGGTPGCLLMALVAAETGRDWNGCGAGGGGGKGGKAAAVAGGGAPPYAEFQAAAKALGFGAMLVSHKPYL